MTAPDAAIIAAYQQQTATTRAQLERAITALWLALGVYRGPQAARFVKDAVALVAAAQGHMASLTVGYLAAQGQAVTGRSMTARVKAAGVTGAAARGGVDPREVYMRPFHLVWRQLHDLPHKTGSIEAAINAGQQRAVQTALTDVQLTKVRTSQQVAEADKRVKWVQRVLEGPYSCGLCIVASTQRYHKINTLAIHPACDCSARFVYSDTDPGPLIDVDRLADLHQRIEDAFGRSDSGARTIPGTGGRGKKAIQYRDALITHEHGELGPVLAVRGRPFLGPAEL